jgi:23S rRNA (adenine2503-C2)-methyltransferase
MLKDVNDSIEHAKELVELIKPTYAYVNLIPYNQVDENGFKRADNTKVKAFMDYLMKHGVTTTIRKEFGSDIDAACGQLRAKHQRG